jgi:hypothetical protein
MTDITAERVMLWNQGLDMISRETWDARQDYTSARTVFVPVEGFVLHVSVTNRTNDEHADMRTIERIGEQRFGIGCSYNAAVFQSGNLYEAQPLTRRGAHTVDDKNVGYKSTGSTRSMNYWWRAIVLPPQPEDKVTDAQVDQIARWAAAQIRAGYAKRDAQWIGHRDVAWKACPGDAGYNRLSEIRTLTKHYTDKGLVQEQELQEDDDMTVVRDKSNGDTMVAYGGKLMALTGHDNIASAEIGGVPVWPIEHDDYTRMVTHFGPVLK